MFGAWGGGLVVVVDVVVVVGGFSPAEVWYEVFEMSEDVFDL